MDKQPISQKLADDKPAALDRYFTAAVKMQASDFHLKGDEIPRMRSNGELRRITGNPIAELEVEKMVFEILSAEQKEFFLGHGALDFAYDLSDTDRFRVNVFRQRGKVSLAARRVTSVIPPFESLNLPPIVERVAGHHQGLVIVAGATGSGKSTTIASMLDHINRTRHCHIITIEDPIEFVYKDEKALVNQREIGIDVPSFEDALRSLMREDPDVVLIGEMRDYATLNAGLKAAETGHLVFATLHSTDAYQTIARALDLTPEIERHMVRQALVGNLRAVVCQRLLPTIVKNPPRVPAVEIMLVNASIRKLMAEERENEVSAVIKSSHGEGMLDYTESLRRLIEEEMIDLKTAYANAPNPDELKMSLKGISIGGGGILG